MSTVALVMMVGVARCLDGEGPNWRAWRRCGTSGKASDGRQPMRVFGISAIDDVKECALDFFGDRATATHIAVLAEFKTIQLADRRDFSCRATEKCFVADINLVAGDALLHHVQPQVLADVQHGV